jgi:GNAT superfamily N-acetyltransferase
LSDEGLETRRSHLQGSSRGGASGGSRRRRSDRRPQRGRLARRVPRIDQRAYLTAYDGLPRLRQETLAEPGDDDIQLVAVDGEEMVGWVAGGPAHEDDLGPGAYEVRACYVDPARWRTGVGRWLMAALINRLDPGRWTHLVLWTVRDAAPTNAFYVSLGMVRDGREALLDRGGPVPLVRFSVLLKRMRTNAPTTTVPTRTDG